MNSLTLSFAQALTTLRHATTATSRALHLSAPACFSVATTASPPMATLTKQPATATPPALHTNGAGAPGAAAPVNDVDGKVQEERESVYVCLCVGVGMGVCVELWRGVARTLAL